MQKLRGLFRLQLWRAVLFAALLPLLGCASPQSKGTSPSDTIVQLNVITVPVALDLDGRAGADGVALKLYANDARHPKAVPLRNGTVEILLFDGTFFGRTNVPAPLRTFSFTIPELRAQEFTSNIGVGYQFSLLWATNRPTQRIMSVAARYTTRDGAVITSRPSSVTVLEK